jgi:threonine/homoserine/homoserine lactone efflux protein
MKKTLSMLAVSLVFSFLLLQVFMPITASAALTSSCVSNTPQTQGMINNPLKVNSIQCLIEEVLQFVVNLLAIAGVLYLIWTGFMFVKAQGNPTELEKAKKSFVNAIIGMAIILGAWAIANVIANTINKVTDNNNAALGTVKNN